MDEGKPFEISKHQVMEAYGRVKAKNGAGGIDGVGFTEFEKDLKTTYTKYGTGCHQDAIFPPQSEESKSRKRMARKDC